MVFLCTCDISLLALLHRDNRARPIAHFGLRPSSPSEKSPFFRNHQAEQCQILWKAGIFPRLRFSIFQNFQFLISNFFVFINTVSMGVKTSTRYSYKSLPNYFKPFLFCPLCRNDHVGHFAFWEITGTSGTLMGYLQLSRPFKPSRPRKWQPLKQNRVKFGILGHWQQILGLPLAFYCPGSLLWGDSVQLSPNGLHV